MSDETPSRVTINQLYQQQLQNEKLLIEMSQRLANMEQMPSRVRELELQQARNAWVEKVAYSALIAGVGALVGGMITVL